MDVHIFRATGRVFGFTLDAVGANLPQQIGPWTEFKTVIMTRDVPVPGVEVNQCLNDIDAFGFHITDAHVRITDRYV